MGNSKKPTYDFQLGTGNGKKTTYDFQLGNNPLAFWSGQSRVFAHHDFSGLILSLEHIWPAITISDEKT